MISHLNVINNILQIEAYERQGEEKGIGQN